MGPGEVPLWDEGTPDSVLSDGALGCLSGYHPHMAFLMLLEEVSGDWARLQNGSPIFQLSMEGWAAGIRVTGAGKGTVGPRAMAAS